MSQDCPIYFEGECFSKVKFFVCMPGYVGQLILLFSFFLPVFISILLRRYPSVIKIPTYDIIHDVICSFFFSIFITSIICIDSDLYLIFLCISVTILFLFIIEGAFFKISCYNNAYQIFQKIISRASNAEPELQYILEVLMRSPPILRYSLMQEPQTPTKNSKPIVVSGPDFEQYQEYQTWEDRSGPLDLPETGIYLIDFNIQVIFSTHLQSTVEQKENSLNNNYHGSRYFVKINPSTTSSWEPTYFVIGGEPYKKGIFYKSCGFSTLFAFSKFIPIRSLISWFILRDIKKLTINIIKYVSDTDEFRCQAYKIDRDIKFSSIGSNLPFKPKVTEDPPISENIRSHQFDLNYIQDILPSIVVQYERNSLSESSKKNNDFNDTLLRHITIPGNEFPFANQSSSQNFSDQKIGMESKADTIKQSLINEQDIPNQFSPYQVDI